MRVISMVKKKGSAMIYVILMLAVLFTVSIGVMQITLASLKQSSSFYQKNQAYYYADSSTDKILYFLDIIADEARNKANQYCYTPSGSPNLDTPEIKNIYENYLSNNDKSQYEENIRAVFKEKYTEYLDKFFNGEIDINKEVNVGDNTITISGKWINWKNQIKNQISNSVSDVDFNLFREMDENGEEFKKYLKII